MAAKKTFRPVILNPPIHRPRARASVSRKLPAQEEAHVRHAAHRHYHLLRRRGETTEPQTALTHFPERALPGALTEPSPEDTALAHEARAELASELDLDTLSAATTPAFWRAFHAYAVLNVPIPLIADSERVPEGTITTRIRLARQDLQSTLRRRRAKKRP